MTPRLGSIGRHAPALRPDRRLGIAVSALVAALAAVPGAASAQDDDDGPVTVSRPVIQRIPGKDSMTLNEALTRLGNNPRDVGALIDAGNAALTMGDVDAATGFFRRADQLSPGNPKVKAGLAGAMVRNGNPFEAIPLFQEAERAGAIDPAIAGDRGLAYDLVGDNAAAQRYYRIALASGNNDEVARRLALSLAIAGDRRGSDAALSSQLRQQDQSAWRTRAFALAILGQTEEAVTIARTILPGELAAAIAPYLRYMPRLTPAQQAAAANFGAFPRASEIGRDDPRIALYAPAGRRPAVAVAETTQAPGGRQTRADRERARREERTQRAALAAREAAARTSRASTARVAPGNVQPAIEAPRTDRPAVAARTPARVARAELPAVAARTAPPPRAVATAPAPAPIARAPALQPVPTPTADPLARAVATPAPTAVVAAQPSAAAPAIAPAPRPVVVSTVANPGAAPQAGLSMSAPVVGSDRPTVPLPEPGFDLTRPPSAAAAAPAVPVAPVPNPANAAAPSPVTPVVGAPGPSAAPAPVAAPAPTLERPSLASAFADLGRPTDVLPAAGAVDIRRLQPARPKPAEAKPAKPAPPSHPSRIWVQIATGRDKAALNFDWRRLTRQSAELFKGKSAYVSAWGQTNRLLTGPFASETAANAFIAQLRRADVAGPFVWTSPAGQVVDALGGR